jgi:serine/threonine protein kinase
MGTGRDRELIDSLRAQIEAGTGTALGHGYQATVERFDTAVGPVVVKRAHAGRLLGSVARAAIARERAVYERLAGVPGIPKFYGAIDNNCLIIEYISGPSLRAHEAQLGDRAAFFDALLATLERMHAAGVAHGDLKRKDNTLVGPGEQPYIIDFGIACIRRAGGGPVNRLWFDWMQQMDYNAWTKLKHGRRPANLPAADRERYKPLWIEQIARAVRIAWQRLTLRRWRKGRRNEK